MQRLPRSSGASALCRPPLPPRSWPFASLLAVRFRQPLAGLLFHGLHDGRGRGCDKLRARPRGLSRSAAATAKMTGQGRRPAAAVAWPPRRARAPEWHHSVVVGQTASAEPLRTQPAATDVARATSAFTVAAGAPVAPAASRTTASSTRPL